MDEKKLKALATELAKGLKTEADLNQFSYACASKEVCKLMIYRRCMVYLL